MRALLQRVTRAAVRVEGREIARIGPGLVVLLGVERGDDASLARRMAERVATFRVFPPADPAAPDRMDASLVDRGLEALVVSQVTLAHRTRKGRRPSLDGAAAPEAARAAYAAFAEALEALGVGTATGRFGARMEVELWNDGPVTFLLEGGPAASGTAASSTQVLA